MVGRLDWGTGYAAVRAGPAGELAPASGCSMMASLTGMERVLAGGSQQEGNGMESSEAIRNGRRFLTAGDWDAWEQVQTAQRRGVPPPLQRYCLQRWTRGR